MAAKKLEVSLSDLQLAVMRVLWDRREASTTDVVEAMSRPRTLAHTTVATLLTRLERRGLLTVRRDGRQLYYRARVSEDAVRRSMVGSLLGNLFGGDARALVAHLVRDDEVAPGDMQRIKELLRDTEGGQ
ncbi:MAG: BlaI/MecI/CopY family transcriptional regulator [Lysobacterales bacterium]